ncbi:glycosyltransferase family 39 protein [Candidatus Woesearchaeota archaeon]|nr:glycosyltransferase family 39 protein [Candidatus Woesearchaeota archaeon]
MFKKISLWYALVLFLCFIVYPWWLLIDSFPKGMVIVNIILVLIIGGYYILREMFQDTRRVTVLPSKKKEKNTHCRILLLVVLFLLLLGIHAYSLSFPIQPSDDEHFHVSKGVYFAESIRLVVMYLIQNYLFQVIVSLLFLLGIGYLLIKNKDYLQDRWKKLKISSKIFFVFCGILTVNVYVITLRLLFEKVGLTVFGSSDPASLLGWLIRFPPLGTITNGFVSLLGFEEVFFARVIQLVFLFFAALYLYKLLSLFIDKETAAISSILFLFVPGIFYFSNLAFMTGGEVFFLLAASYYFVKYIHTYLTQQKHALHELGLLFLLLLLGVFYKEPVLFIVPVFAVSLVFEYSILYQWNWEKSRQVFKEFKAFWLLTLLVLVFAGVWIIIRSTFFTLTNSQQQYLVFLKLFSFNTWIKYLALFPELLTWPLLLLFLLSVVYFLTMHFKNIFLDKDFFAVRFSLLWILILLSIYVMYNWREPVLRFIVVLIPPVVVLLSIFIFRLCSSLLLRRIVYSIFLFMVILYSMAMTYQHIEDHYWPYDELYQYIGEDVSPDQKVLFLIQHIDFYRVHYGIDTPIIRLQQIPYAALKSETAFIKFLDDNNVTYVAVADSNNLVYTPASFTEPDEFSEQFYKPQSLFFENLNNSVDMFALEKEFGSKNNRLFLVKVLNKK